MGWFLFGALLGWLIGVVCGWRCAISDVVDNIRELGAFHAKGCVYKAIKKEDECQNLKKP